MELQAVELGNRGMFRDTAISKQTNEFAFENLNVRITAIDGNTRFIVTNDINASVVSFEDDIPIIGEYVGYCLFNQDIVLFTHSSDENYPDYIYKLHYSNPDTFTVTKLYEGNLGFSDCVEGIDALPYYEKEDIRKVYWVDGVHSPRVINIATDNTITHEGDGVDTQFDFQQEVSSLPEVEITKEYNGIGQFPSGTMQYIFTYYKKYGAESAAVYISPLLYLSLQDRGAKADETCSCSFDVNISNVDTNFDGIRVYSIVRTSLEGTVACYLVKDVEIHEDGSTGDTTVSFVDDGAYNNAIAESEIYYLGGQEIVAGTIDQKDGVLFLGNITIKESNVDFELKGKINNYLKSHRDNNNISNLIYFSYKTIDYADESGYYQYKNQLSENSANIQCFKGGETYRFGVRFFDKNNHPTQTFWIGDQKCDIYPQITNSKIYISEANFNFNLYGQDFYNDIIEKYKCYQLMWVLPTFADRDIVAQGVTLPTIYNYAQRYGNSPYAQSSYITRLVPNLNEAGSGSSDYDQEWAGSFGRHETNVQKSEIDKKTEIEFLVAKDENDAIENADNSFSNQSAYTNREIGVYLKYEFYDNIQRIYVSASQILFDGTIRSIHSPLTIIRNTTTYKSYKADILNAIYDGDFPNAELNNDNHNRTDKIFKSGEELTEERFNSIKNDIGQGPGYIEYRFTREPQNIYEVDKENNFFVDANICTFNSPEVTYDKIQKPQNVEYRIVGIAPITSVISDYYMEASKSGNFYANARMLIDDYNKPYNSINPTLLEHKFNGNYDLYTNYYNGIKTIPIWQDGTHRNDSSPVDIQLSMWHRSYSMVSPSLKNIESLGKEVSGLKHKIFANKFISYRTSYYFWNQEDEDFSNKICDELQFNSIEKRLSDINLYNDDQNIVALIAQNNNNLFYAGQYDNVLVPKHKTQRYCRTSNGDFVNPTSESDYRDRMDAYPCRIKYSSTKHLILKFLNYTSGKVVLPNYCIQYTAFDNYDYPFTLDGAFEYDGEHGDNNYVRSECYENTIDSLLKNSVYIGEIYREIPSSARYGGYDQNAIENNTFYACSEIKSLISQNAITSNSGDTYFQRWDCLRTYPTTEEDENSVVDIVSFFVETHINIDGRCDVNRFNQKLINARPTNFGLLNEVYSQPNNFYSSSVLDEKFDTDVFSNEVIWTKPKQSSADIDTWTNINLTNSLDLNGSNGEIVKIMNVLNNIIVFQEKALSIINYNNRTALSTENGQAVELGYSGIVNGYTTISDHIGLQYKDLVINTADGVYFVDKYNKSLYRYTKGGLENLSQTKGFEVWFRNNIDKIKRIYHDGLTYDTYLLNDDDSRLLSFNTQLDSFVSFYDKYGDPYFFVNISGNSYYFDLDNNLQKDFAGDPVSEISIRYRVNPEPLVNKTFTNLEINGDIMSNEEKVLSGTNEPFTSVQVFTPYQTSDIVGDFKKRFNVWRIALPREEGKKNRMQGTWCYITLKNNKLSDKKLQFHSAVLKYYK